MPNRVVTREEVIEAFRPLRPVLEAAVVWAHKHTTLERYAMLHPEHEREAGLKRLAGQARWMLLADRLVIDISGVDGFGVRTSSEQHNQGQYLFECPGGLWTVKQDPHDASDPEDGKYVQEELEGIRKQAKLAPGINGDDPLMIYLSVTRTTAQLKVVHSTVREPLKIPLADLVEPAKPLDTRMPATPTPRARARSRRVARTDEKPTADGDGPGVGFER
jgi:hypothetical protein